MRDAIFMIVRKSVDGYEWNDTSTASRSVDDTRIKAARTDALIPNWALANPIVRVGHFLIEEA